MRKAHHPDPVPERGGDTPRHARGSAAVRSRASTSSKCSSSTTAPRDGTADVARACGVDHIVRFRRNKGLAAAFTAGIDAALKAGADFIVNTDADNQYPGREIPKLLAPLLSGDADIVIGDRNIAEVAHMSWRKRQLQRLGSWVVRQVSNTTVPDTTSGFRAYTRDAALRMTIVSEFSYTLESIIQAGKKRMAITHVEIATNPRTRDSRLFGSVFSYIKRSSATIVRIYTMYEPLKVFTYIGLDAVRRRVSCWGCG